MKKVYVLLSGLFFLTACGGDEKKENKITKEEKVEVKEPKEEVIYAYDTLLTDLSKYIAGIKTEKYLTEQQALASYETHRKFTDTSWAKTQKNMLTPIGQWCINKKITDASDSALCFYPLSGPDFLFGNTFFPHAKNYVLLGLEPNGSMCDFRDLTEAQNTRYLSGIRESMAYLNKAGYFVTSHMSGDFTKAQLNGMVHMMLYMMARTNHTILSIEKIKVDSAGMVSITTEKKFDEPNLAGVRIEFLSPDQKTKKSAYYFRLNARDVEIKKLTGFVPFIENFGKRVAYMKSGSCVLVNGDFSVIRNLVLQSDKVLQDDTGVPYNYFKSDSTFSISLFGNYTKVIDDLKWCFQTDLKKEILLSPDNKPLPFRISYNGNYNEGMLLFAKRKKNK